MSEYLAESYDKALRENDALRSRLAEAERERDTAFETWKKFHQETLAAFIKNEHELLKLRLAEAEALLQIAAFTDALDPTDGVRLGWEYCVFCGEREHDQNCRYAKFLASDSATHRENDRHD